MVDNQDDIFGMDSIFGGEEIFPNLENKTPKKENKSSNIDSEEAKQFLEEDLNLKDFEEKESLDIVDIILSPTRAIYFYLNSYYYGFNLMKEIQMGMAVGTVALLLGLVLQTQPFKLAIIMISILLYILAIVRISTNGDRKMFREIIKDDLTFVKDYKSWVNTDTSIPRDLLHPPLRNQLYKEDEQEPMYKHTHTPEDNPEKGSKISKFFNKFKSNSGKRDEVDELMEEYTNHHLDD